MPEGPELWALGQMLTRAGVPSTVVGKHLWAAGQDYHFGLTGRARLAAGVLTHIPAAYKSYLSGKVDATFGSVEDLVTAHNLGVDWMTGTEVQLATRIAAAMASRATLGSWMLKQECIAGVGVAWASEMCAAAGLRPDLPCNTQNLRGLASVYLAFQGRLMGEYGAILDAVTTPEEFVNAWCDNLYASRRMAVYQGGTTVLVSGRVFWV